MGHLRLVAVLAVAALAGLAVWIWLPPTAETRAATAQAIAGFETAREPVWPRTAYGRSDLTAAQQSRLAETTLRRLATYAAGDALTSFDAAGSVEALGKSREPGIDEEVLGWRGKVVYQDVLRRTLNGRLIVRAGVLLWHEVGTWDATSGRLVDRRWIEHTAVPVREYTLGDYGTGWKVEAVRDWGRCEQDGSHVQEGPPAG